MNHFIYALWTRLDTLTDQVLAGQLTVEQAKSQLNFPLLIITHGEDNAARAALVNAQLAVSPNDFVREIVGFMNYLYLKRSDA